MPRKLARLATWVPRKVFGRGRKQLDPRRLKKRLRRRIRLVVILILVVLVVLFVLMPLGFFAIASENTGDGQAGSLTYTPESIEVLATATGIPAEALASYLHAAGAYPVVSWAILAGIGQEECNHGQSTLPGCLYGTVNFCGARGPMQFLGNVWRAGTDPVPVGSCPGEPGESGAEHFTGDPVGPPVPEGQEGQGYATDGDGIGGADPWTWLDATHAAARKLERDGVQDNPRAAISSYNPNDSYVDAVLANAGRYADIEAELLASGQLTQVGLALAGAGCPTQPRGSTDPVTNTRNTEAMRATANAVISCFGRPHAVYCYEERPGDLYEHPRGRACDFMATSGGPAAGEERAWGLMLAEWVAANAEALNVLYVIWWDRSWNPSDGLIPWDQWRDYEGCANPCTSASTGHYNHVHVSVRLMPGDPDWAFCGPAACAE